MMIEPSQKKAKIETQILVAEAAAKMKAEVKLKKQREREREAARIALQKMEKTVEIEKNLEIEMDFVQKRRCIRDLFFGGLTWLPLRYAYCLSVVSCLTCISDNKIYHYHLKLGGSVSTRRLTRLPSIPKNVAKFRKNGNHSS
ncbi:hypothetical protein GOBAR_AA09915 [Gossypium barbadense]|uniref:Uncharacterized protein n=1 Tax=Gossypium barbadense TaxID=3634 RepID=A0A2P5Y579_GOSBA|nr:hypothetical protein GOBAR_AA09915 [Gossypium barbadense]